MHSCTFPRARPARYCSFGSSKLDATPMNVRALRLTTMTGASCASRSRGPSSCLAVHQADPPRSLPQRPLLRWRPAVLRQVCRSVTMRGRRWQRVRSFAALSRHFSSSGSCSRRTQGACRRCFGHAERDSAPRVESLAPGRCMMVARGLARCASVPRRSPDGLLEHDRAP